MKNIKKIASLLMALSIIFALASNAFAAPVFNNDTGKITVTGTVAGQTYTPYQILKLDSYDDASDAYVYVPHPDWAAWLATQTAYVTIGAGNVVSWVKDASAAEFAKAAMKYASDNGIAPAQAGKTAAADNEKVVFEGLNLGYYLIDSTLGALCALNTTRPEVEVAEKNYETTIDKKVNNGLTNVAAPAGYDYKESVTKQIGTIVDFAVTIDLYPGATNYVYHDSMTDGLTYVNTAEYPTEVWTYPMNTGSKLDAAHYTVNAAPSCEHGGKKCDFTITFSQAYLDTITKHEKVTVRYFAELNENAVTYHEDSDGNINYAKLTYGQNSETEWDPAVVYTYSFELVKVDTKNTVLTGAEFELYDAPSDGNLIPLVAVGELDYPLLDENGNPTTDPGTGDPLTIKLPTYRPATTAEIADPSFESAKIVVGRAVVKGLPLGKTYYLDEVTPPAGFTPVVGRISVLLSQSTATNHILVNGSSDHMAVVLSDTYHSGGVAVLNQKGNLLPDTGGIGTTIFYTLGSCMVLGALVLFLTKRRMIAER